MMSETKLIFVYGTLMEGMRADWQVKRLGGVLDGYGTIEADLWDVGGFPGITPGEDLVHGEVYEFEDLETALNRFDHYEGVANGLYKRRLTLVKMEDAEDRLAWAYWFNRSVQGLRRVGSGDYRKYLAEKGMQ